MDGDAVSGCVIVNGVVDVDNEYVPGPCLDGRAGKLACGRSQFISQATGYRTKWRQRRRKWPGFGAHTVNQVDRHVDPIRRNDLACDGPGQADDGGIAECMALGVEHKRAVTCVGAVVYINIIGTVNSS